MLPSTTAVATCACAVVSAVVVRGQETDIFDQVKDEYAVSEGGVKIHYAAVGEGPLVVIIHGFSHFCAASTPPPRPGHNRGMCDGS